MWASPVTQWLKNPPANAGDAGLICELGRSPGEENDNPLQYSCLENPMDGGAWLATVHGVAKCRTRLSDFTIRYVFRDFLFPESSLTPINWPGLPQQKPPF